jgi:SAM-dependent methyltransferase
MTELPNWAPPGVDTKRANTARVYDYLLGGSHNFLADQDAGRALAAVDPNARVFAQANRAFLGRAVRFLAANGIRQFLDIGSGIPTEGNVHEVAQQAAPGSRVAYVDIDPVAIAHSKAILAGDENTAIVEADLHVPEKILTGQAVGRLSTPIHLRSRAEIRRFFDGFEVVDPGLVYVSTWRPESPGDVPGDPSRYGNLVGVARKG